jgi:hypothetical protein
MQKIHKFLGLKKTIYTYEIFLLEVETGNVYSNMVKESEFPKQKRGRAW